MSSVPNCVVSVRYQAARLSAATEEKRQRVESDLPCTVDQGTEGVRNGLRTAISECFVSAPRPGSKPCRMLLPVLQLFEDDSQKQQSFPAQTQALISHVITDTRVISSYKPLSLSWDSATEHSAATKRSTEFEVTSKGFRPSWLELGVCNVTRGREVNMLAGRGLSRGSKL